MVVLTTYLLVRLQPSFRPCSKPQWRNQIIHRRPPHPSSFLHLQFTKSTFHSNSNLPHPQRHRWFKKITSNQSSSSLIISGVILVAGITWSYHHLQSQSKDTLNIEHYRPFKIMNSKLIAPDAALLGINVSLPDLVPVSSPFYIESIYLKHPALQIERPYTPLSSITPSNNNSEEVIGTKEASSCGVINLLVKKYSEGDMSTYLHDVKAPGNQVEIRGPVPTWYLPNDQQIDELIFIAAGTGITPAIQLLRRFFPTHDRSQQIPYQNLPKFRLIYVAQSLETSYFLDEIRDYQLNYPEQMDLKLLITNNNNKKKENDTSLLKEKKIIISKLGRLEFSDIQNWVGSHKLETRKLIIVCGPESLIRDVAGNRGHTFNSQGQLGGMLKSLGYSSHHVVKL